MTPDLIQVVDVLTEEQVDDIYEKWILEQEELHNAEK